MNNKKKNLQFYESINMEPFHTFQDENSTIQFYFVDGTPFYEPLLDKTYVAQWVRNGNDYKVLLVKEYYQKFQLLYSDEYTKINLAMFKRRNSFYKKSQIINFSAIITLLVLALGLMFYFQYAKQSMNAFWYTAIISVVVVVALMWIIRTVSTKKIRSIAQDSRNMAYEKFGEKKLNDIFEGQQTFANEYVDEYMKRNDNLEIEKQKEEENIPDEDIDLEDK